MRRIEARCGRDTPRAPPHRSRRSPRARRSSGSRTRDHPLHAVAQEVAGAVFRTLSQQVVCFGAAWRSANEKTSGSDLSSQYRASPGAARRKHMCPLALLIRHRLRRLLRGRRAAFFAVGFVAVAFVPSLSLPSLSLPSLSSPSPSSPSRALLTSASQRPSSLLLSSPSSSHTPRLSHAAHRHSLPPNQTSG